MSCFRIARPIVTAALVAVFSSQAQAATTYALIPLSDTAATPLTVPPDGMVTFHLVRSGDRPEQDQTVELTLTEFRDTLGLKVPVDFLEADGKTAAAGPLMVKVGGSPIALRVRVGTLPSPREVRGRVLISVDGVVVKNHEVVFSAPRPERGAKLVLNRTSVTLQGEDAWGRSESARFTVFVRDESGQWDLRGLHAEIADGGVAEFDPQAIIFKVNNHVVENFLSLDSTALNDARRIVPANTSAAIDVILPKLPPGHYTPKIRFRAENSQSDPAQVLAVDMNVRTSVGSAVAWLFFGILLSVCVTTWLKARAAVLRLRLRVLQSRPAWLTDDDGEPTAISTWVSAMFHQAEQTRQFFTVAATDLVDERVTQATQHLPYLEQIAQLRRDIERAGWPPMVRRRALKLLNQINRRFKPGRLDEATGASIQKELDALRAWLPASYAAPYWKSVKGDIDLLRSKVDPRVFAGTPTEALAERLAASIAVDEPPPKMVDVEASYAALKLLWEWRREPGHLKELTARWKSPSSIDDLFLYADTAAWEKLKASKSLRFSKPVTASLEPIEPFEPLTFEVAPEPPSLGDNYLFKHYVRYQWTIQIASRPGWLGKLRQRVTRRVPKPVPLTPRTREPRVVQYAPFPCTMVPSVRLCFENDHIDVNGPDHKPRFRIAVDRSTFTRLVRSIETTEMISVGLALGVGIASGLLTQYFGNNTFGTWRDCIGLFLWGAGSDQAAKSFVEVVNRFPRWEDGKTTTAQTPAKEKTAGAGAVVQLDVGR